MNRIEEIRTQFDSDQDYSWRSQEVGELLDEIDRLRKLKESGYSQGFADGIQHSIQIRNMVNHAMGVEI